MPFKSLASKGRSFLLMIITIFLTHIHAWAQKARTVADFDKGWHFHLGDVVGAEDPLMKDAGWRTLDLGYLVKSDQGSFTMNGLYFGAVLRY